MIPFRYGLKSELAVSRAAIETKDEHCDSDTNNKRLTHTHKQANKQESTHTNTLGNGQ